MPHLFRTVDGRQWNAGRHIPLTFANGAAADGIWGGSAQEEKLKWWLSKPGYELAQTEEVAEVAVRDEDTDEVRWGAAPPGARLFFVLEAPTV
ncbi:MAG TPA: hypothetical protein VD994_01610, partial [Prosthecobacter sp.]|nr:hypothetical protein [Prosthecobacter sp.]